MAGAIIGFTFGNPQIGWMVGSSLGSLVDTHGHSAPDLTDLRPQASEYGRPIPIVYSIMAVGGNVIWASDLVKTSDGDSGGGKGGGGGGGGSGPTYAANFAVLICEADGDIGLGRIWAGPDKRLIYNPTGETMESGSIRFYDGSGGQLPDPLIESYLGAGNVPAYRGFAYVVIEGFDVSAKDGNHIPFLTIEVGRKAAVTPGLGTIAFDRTFYDAGEHWLVSMYHGTYYGALVNNASDKSLVHNQGGVSSYFGYAPYEAIVYDAARNRVVRLFPNANSSNGDHLAILNMDTGSVDSSHSLGMTSSEFGRGAAQGLVSGQYVFASSLTGGGIRFYFVDPTSFAVTHKDFDVGVAGVDLQQNGLYGPSATGVHVWGTCEDGYVRLFDLSQPSGSSSTNLGLLPTGFIPAEANGAYDSINDLLWLVKLTSGTVNYACYSASTQVCLDSIATSFYSLASQPWLFTPDPGDGMNGVWLCGSRWLAVDHYMRFTPLSGFALGGTEVDGVYVGISGLDTVIYNPLNNSVTATREMGWWSETPANDLYPNHLPYHSGYLGTADSSLQKQTLAQIVTDLSVRAGLTAGDINVAALTDQVDGYVLANQVSVKDAISALMPAYFFDAVEDQGQIVFVKRGGAIAVEIPADDLGAHPSGQDGSDLYEVTRVMDEELPRTHSVNYISAATKYSPATKYARRLIGYSGDESRAEFPMVFSDTKAQEIADVNLHTPWVERMKFKFSLPLKYAYLMPTDILGIDGYTPRITKMTQKGAVFDCEAVRDDSHVYTPHVIVTPTPPPSETVSVQSLTLLELM